ncbi:hydroxyacid dehydrogenase [Nesterenkonia halophila]|uniref:hydroxyacid dehydrogenase n=1 Tax=Nesterenkonia halophila TaxID=302044 RepID=UPI001292B834|nr:hydroxyacid dehydrogenase [Nesterenkonia halophila]
MARESSRPTALLAMSEDAAASVIGATGRAELDAVADLLSDEPLTTFRSPGARRLLAEAEVLITGWGCPPIDEQVLDAAPRLAGVFHAAGSVRGHVGPNCFERGLIVSSAAAANARPVVEYTLAMILLEGKRVLPRAAEYRRQRRMPSLAETHPSVGNNGLTVGILSASIIGRGVMRQLRHHDVEVLLADPFVDADTAARHGAQLVEAEELFRRSDVVSLHTPLLPTTRGLVGRELISSMQDGAVLINTARGAVVDQEALTEALLAGRIRAVLDVTDPEELPAEHPLWDSEHVLITPHLAGSQGNELARLRDMAVAELRRWVAGEPLHHAIRHDTLELIA